MKDLEKYINANREELDHVEEPEIDLIWEGIRTQLQNEQELRKDKDRSGGWQLQIGRNWKWAMAASIVLAIGTFYMNRTAPVQEVTSVAALMPELAEEEQNFQLVIAQKEEALGLNQIRKEDYQEIFLELELLESIHQEQLADAPQFEKNDQLVKTLLKYYERKIRILERLSNEIEKKNHHEERNREQQI